MIVSDVHAVQTRFLVKTKLGNLKSQHRDLFVNSEEDCEDIERCSKTQNAA
jgi:hypothetical protein